MSKKFVCTQCGHVGYPKKVVGGSLGIEIFLWLCFIIPGLVYSLWRDSSRNKVCSLCKNSTLIPVSSPYAKKILEGNGYDYEEYAAITKKEETKSARGKILLWVIILIVVITSFIRGIIISGTKQDSIPQVITPQKTFEFGIYKVDSEQFSHSSQKEVNVWKSHSERSILGKVKQGDIVEVIAYDAQNNYCQIKYKEITGWFSCGWLKKIN